MGSTKLFLLKTCYMSSFFLKGHTNHGGFQKYLILDLIKYQNTQQLQVLERMEEKWQKHLLSQQEKIEKLLLKISEGKLRDSLNFKSHSCPTENEFSFLQNTIWSVIKNFLYSSEEDVTFISYFRRYEDLYTTDCVNWSDSKKKFVF